MIGLGFIEAYSNGGDGTLIRCGPDLSEGGGTGKGPTGEDSLANGVGPK